MASSINAGLDSSVIALRPAPAGTVVAGRHLRRRKCRPWRLAPAGWCVLNDLGLQVNVAAPRQILPPAFGELEMPYVSALGEWIAEPPMIEAELNRLGRECWELVSFDGEPAVLKRRLAGVRWPSPSAARRRAGPIQTRCFRCGRP
jgi:hypothetical protein